MYEIRVYETKSNDWNWSLSYNGEKMAMGCEGPGGFSSRSTAIDNLQAVARVFLSCGGQLTASTLTPGEHDLGLIGGKTPIKVIVENAA